MPKDHLKMRHSPSRRTYGEQARRHNSKCVYYYHYYKAFNMPCVSQEDELQVFTCIVVTLG